MPNYGWQDIDVILVNGYNVQLMTVIDLALPKSMAVIEKLHGAGNTWAGAKDTGTRRADGDVTLRTVYDTADDRSREAFITNAHVASGVLCVGLEGNTAGKNAKFFTSHQVDYIEEPNPDQVTKLATTWTVDGQIHEGPIIAALQAIAADGNTEAASIDNGALSSNGGVAVLQVNDLDLGGHDGLVGKVRHSDDNVTFADLVTFTTVTAANAAEIKTVAAGTTVNRYLAASWDFTGAGSPTASVFVAFKRN